MTERTEQIYFSDPRLAMSIPGRLFVRFTGYVGYLITAAASVTFLSSDVPWVRWAGVLIGMILVDRFLHREKADRALAEFPEHGTANLSHYLTPPAFRVLERAFDKYMLADGNIYLETLRELLERNEVQAVFRRLDIPRAEFRQRLEELLRDAEAAHRGTDRTRANTAVAQIVRGAFRAARTSHHQYIFTHDLLTGLARAGDPALDRLLEMFGIVGNDLERAAVFGIHAREFMRLRTVPRSLHGMSRGTWRGGRHRIMNRAWTSRPTPALDAVSVDYTDLAREGQIGFLVGHEREFEEVVRVLAHEEDPNALLIGETSSGKETIVMHLAAAIVNDKTPSPLFDKRLVAIDTGALRAGADESELLRRVETITAEAVRAGNVIFYIPEFDTAISACMPIVRQSLVPVIAATTPREYAQAIEPRSDAVGLFQKVLVEEISKDEAEVVLAHEAIVIEARRKVVVSFAAIKKAVEIGGKYMRDSLLPGSALQLLREAAAYAKERDDETVVPDHVVHCAEAKTNIPIHNVTAVESETLLNLEDTIHETFIDQNEAVKGVSDALREYRSGLGRKGGPIASFLFVGPTGVGKTELAKTLARIEFGTEDALTRFDMTEYQDKASIVRFIGSADGTIPGALTEAVRNRPYAVVLLDEFEKASPEIVNLFLQVLDDGRLTDGMERTVHFDNTIVIATSNAHSPFILESLARGRSVAEIREELQRRLTEVFRPELVNRFSKIVTFKNLEPGDVAKIAYLELNRFGKQVAEKGIRLTITPEAADRIGALGYHPEYGARPLRAVIEERVRAPMAERILRGEVRYGSVITLAVQDGNIVLR